MILYIYIQPAGTFTGQRFQRNRTPHHNDKGVLFAKTMPRKVSQKCLCDNPSRDFVSKREDFAQEAFPSHRVASFAAVASKRDVPVFSQCH